MMKKITLLCCVWAMLFPFAKSFAQENQAIQIATRLNASASKDYRVQIDEIMLGDRSGGDSDRNGKSFTFAGWFNMSSYFNYSNAHSGSVIMGHRARMHCNYNGSLILVADANGVLKIVAGGKNDFVEPLNATIDRDTWTYLVLQYDNENQEVKVYKDGELVNTKSLSDKLFLFEDDPCIFCVGDCGFAGLCDELHYFNRAISAEEVKQAFNGEVRGINGLTGLWDFNELSQNGIGSFDNQIAESPNAGVQAKYYSYEGVVSSDGGLIDNSWTDVPKHTTQETSALLVSGRTAETPEGDLRTVTINNRIPSYGGTCTVTTAGKTVESGGTVPEGSVLTINCVAEGNYGVSYVKVNDTYIKNGSTYLVETEDIVIEYVTGSKTKFTFSSINASTQVSIDDAKVNYTFTDVLGQEVDLSGNTSYIMQPLKLNITSVSSGYEVASVGYGLMSSASSTAKLIDGAYEIMPSGSNCYICYRLNIVDGIQDNAADAFRLVYVAPQLHIEGKPADATVSVYSLAGTLVTTSADSVIDLSTQPAGCYIVKVSGSTVNKTMKIILK